jgi:hypothetical protein
MHGADRLTVAPLSPRAETWAQARPDRGGAPATGSPVKVAQPSHE